MKKTLVALFCCLGVLLSVNARAFKLNGRFFEKEDGRNLAKIELFANGRVEIEDYETGDRWSGTYDIEGEFKPGETNLIHFVLNGQTATGRFLFPTYGRKAISFDGRYFELHYR